jgi:arylsulfatase A-like enzyme
MKIGQRRSGAAILAASIAAVLSVSLPTLDGLAQRRPPNVLLIVSDDMGYGDIGIHGGKDIPTPNIDALAKAGIRFTDAYVTGPYCSPTRAGLLTGRYPQRFGHEFNIDLSPAHSDAGLPLRETTLADRLRAAGYRTAIFGKWHLGAAEKHHPLSRGFDEFFGFLAGQHSYVDPQPSGPNPLLDGRLPVQEASYLTDALTDRAVDFIKRHRAQPFFLYLAFNAVHTPMQAPEKYLARFSTIPDGQRRTYAAMLAAMDDGIGRTLDALKTEGLDENTLVIFFNDNGGPTMPGTTINGASNGLLRGSKRQTWEGGIRVASVFRWTGRLPENKVERRPIIQLDVFPTALAAAGVAVQPHWKLDGVNLLPYLRGQRASAPHQALYWRLGEHMAIRKGDWKLVRTSERPLERVDSTAFADLSGAGLYNLAEDVGETNDLAKAYPQRVKELGAAWLKWNAELARPLWSPAGRGIAPTRQ